MTKKELEFLHSLVGKIKARTVVEIGCLYGLSTIALADQAGRVFAIDNFSVNGSDAKPYFAEKVLAQFENITLIEGDSGEVSKDFSQTVDLLFVDGNHMKDGIERDCEMWLPKITKGGIAVFHDYYNSDFPSIAPTVDEATSKGWKVIGRADSAHAVKKI